MRYATNPNTGTRNTMANQKRLFIPRIRASWYTHNPMSRKATYRPRRKSQNPTAEPDAVAWNGVAMSPRMTGISLTLRRGLYRAAFPQAIFISLCANSSNRREGDRLAELTTGALLLVIGVALSVIGILFFPFLCIGIPLLIVGVILIVAEGGQLTKPRPMMYPGYPAPYGYPPYAPPLPPAPPAPLARDPGQPPAAGLGSFCTNCGSPLCTGISFCPNCGTRLAR